jgi:ureidoglycolate lyase
MRTLKVKELSPSEFLPYGHYADLVRPAAERIGVPPVEFFRDMVQQDLGAQSAASYSVCRVEKREMVIDATEYHSLAAEGVMPIDNDVVIHVAPATPPDGGVPTERMAAFRVPKGTMVVLRPGVWHHAPFTVNDSPAHVLVVLPERTYANDCQVFHLEGVERVGIDL